MVVPLVLLVLLATVLVPTGGPSQLRGSSRHVGAGATEQRLHQFVPPADPPTPKPQVVSDDDVAQMVARRKALLGPAIGLRRDVVAANLPDLDSTFEVKQDMKDQFGPLNSPRLKFSLPTRPHHVYT